MVKFVLSAVFFVFISMASDGFASDNINNNVLDSYQQIEANYFDPNLNIDIKVLEKSLPTTGIRLTELDKLRNRAYKACLSLKGQGSLKLKPEESFKYIQEYAQKLGTEKGDSFIIYVLASLYENGTGIKKNLKKASNLYALAYKLGNQRAQEGQGRVLNLLGVSYMLGKDVEKEEKMAAITFREAFELGNMNAGFNLGRCYEDGKGVEQNYQSAFNFYKIVSTSKNSKTIDAHFKLAEFYRDGKGIEKDHLQAINYYHQIDNLLEENQTEKKRDCYFNLGRLYHQENPYDIELLEKAFKFYENADSLKHPTVLQYLETCKMDMYRFKELGEILDNFGVFDEKKKKAIISHASKLFLENMDKQDKSNILKSLKELKDGPNIEKFVTCLKKLLDHNSFPKIKNTKFSFVKMIQEFSLINFDKLEFLLKNSQILFVPHMTFQEVLDIVKVINKIEDIQHLESIIPLCPDLFIKIKISSSEDDNENNTVQIINKTQDMDGYERAQILKGLGKVKTENLPMAFLCVKTILNPNTKLIDIINAIDTVREILQPEKQENNSFEIIEKNENSNQSAILPIDINKIPIIIPLLSKIFNGRETIEQKIEFLNEIGKVNIYKIEKCVQNCLKLTLSRMSVAEKVDIFKSLQGLPEEYCERIIPYALKMINIDTDGNVITKIVNIFKIINDIEKVKMICGSLEKVKSEVSDDQKPVVLEILSTIKKQEQESFIYFSKIISKDMNINETKLLLGEFKKLSKHKRISISRLFDEKKTNFNEKLSVLKEFHKIGNNKTEYEFNNILSIFLDLSKKIKYKNYNEFFLHCISICNILDTIDNDHKIRNIRQCAVLFNIDNTTDTNNIINELNKVDSKKLVIFSNLLPENAFAKESLETIYRSLQSFDIFTNEQLAKVLPYVKKFTTSSTTLEESINLVGVFNNLSQMGAELDDILSFVKSATQHSASKILQILKSIDNSEILKGVLERKSCLRMLNENMDVNQIMEIFKSTYNLNIMDLQRVAPYASLLISKKTPIKDIQGILKKLIEINPSMLQTLVFHAFVNSFEKIENESLLNDIQKISNELSKNPQFIKDLNISMYEFIIYANFISRIYSNNNDEEDIKNINAILQRLISSSNPHRFAMLLQDHADQLEKIYKKNKRWYDLDENYIIYKNLVFTLFNNSYPLETLEKALSKTCEFMTNDMNNDDIMFVFNLMRDSLSIGTEYHEKIISETNKFIKKDMTGKNKKRVLDIISDCFDGRSYLQIENSNKEKDYRRAEKLKKKQKEYETDFEIISQMYDLCITENMSEENCIIILEALIARKYYQSEKLKEYATYIKQITSNLKNQDSIKELNDILNKLRDIPQNKVKKILSKAIEIYNEIEYKGTQDISSFLDVLNKFDMSELDEVVDIGKLYVNFISTSHTDTPGIFYTLYKIPKENRKEISDYAARLIHKRMNLEECVLPMLEILNKINPKDREEVVSYAQKFIKHNEKHRGNQYLDSDSQYFLELIEKFKQEGRLKNLSSLALELMDEREIDSRTLERLYEMKIDQYDQKVINFVINIRKIMEVSPSIEDLNNLLTKDTSRVDNFLEVGTPYLNKDLGWSGVSYFFNALINVDSIEKAKYLMTLAKSFGRGNKYKEFSILYSLSNIKEDYLNIFIDNQNIYDFIHKFYDGTQCLIMQEIGKASSKVKIEKNIIFLNSYLGNNYIEDIQGDYIKNIHDSKKRSSYHDNKKIIKIRQIIKILNEIHENKFENVTSLAMKNRGIETWRSVYSSKLKKEIVYKKYSSREKLWLLKLMNDIQDENKVNLIIKTFKTKLCDVNYEEQELFLNEIYKVKENNFNDIIELYNNSLRGTYDYYGNYRIFAFSTICDIYKTENKEKINDIIICINSDWALHARLGFLKALIDMEDVKSIAHGLSTIINKERNDIFYERIRDFSEVDINKVIKNVKETVQRISRSDRIEDNDFIN